MSEWKKYTLCKICNYVNYRTRNCANYISTENMLPNKGGISDSNIIPTGNVTEYRTGDVLISNIRPYFQKIWYATKNGGCSNDVLCVRATEIVDNKYLYYLLSQQSFFDYVMTGAKGCKMPRGDKKQIMQWKICLPPIDEQKRIASILSALDDKIELNRRINENLEQQAQALFKHWFVDFEFPNADGKPYKSAGGKLVDSELGAIPEGWKVGCLKDISNIIMGQSPKGESFNEQGNGIVFYQGRTQFGTRYPSVKLYTTEPTRYAEPFSVLLSVRAPVGDVNIATQRCCIGRGVASIQSLNGCNFFVFYIMRCTLQPLLQQYNGEGTVFGCINRKALEDIKIIIPPMNIIKNFETIIGSHENLMYKLFLEGKTLVHTRNTLLPKLMNGEISFNNVI